MHVVAPFNKSPNSRVNTASHTALDITKKASNRKPRAYDDDADSRWDDDGDDVYDDDGE
jgi:hypothetical protein